MGLNAKMCVETAGLVMAVELSSGVGLGLEFRFSRRLMTRVKH